MIAYLLKVSDIHINNLHGRKQLQRTMKVFLLYIFW